LPPVDTTQLPTKIAVLSFDHLPKDSGQAIMLGRLLQHVDPASYCQLSLQDHRSHTFPNMHIPHRTDGLPAPFFRIAEAIFHQKWEYRNGATRKQQLVELARAVLHVWKNARSIARIIKKERCKLIVGCSGSIVDLPAAYLASKLASVPFIAYFFDYYSYQAIVPLYKPFTHFAERLVVTGADAVIVPNEHLADEYRRRYGVQAVVIHNPLDDEQSVPVDSEQIDPVEIGTDTLSIVYTGQVYDAHYDAFITLVQAMERLNDPRLKLHIYTAQPVEVLQNAGIRGAVVFHPHLPQSAIRPVQRQADVLFLPLAFNSPYPEIIRTSAPSKLGEYLISGRPILAHVPKGSFVASYLREHNCGLVVDDQDPQLLAEALQKLVRDAELRTTLVRNAQQRASIDFNGYHARAALFSLIGSATKTDS
jgi:glycosyltransferase involved in cell wall biosynthesis